MNAKDPELQAVARRRAERLMVQFTLKTGHIVPVDAAEFRSVLAGAIIFAIGCAESAAEEPAP